MNQEQFIEATEKIYQAIRKAKRFDDVEYDEDGNVIRFDF